MEKKILTGQRSQSANGVYSNNNKTDKQQQDNNGCSSNNSSSKNGFNNNNNGGTSKNPYCTSSNRRSIPQRYKTIDKRPQSKSTPSRERKEQVALLDLCRVGNTDGKNAKKLNLNHLLNFTLTPRDPGGGGWGSSPQSMSTSWKRHNNKWSSGRPTYNKEQFLQANCQFIVRDTTDCTVYNIDPDTLVDWDHIQQVRIQTHEPPSCPICLYPPVCAKITRCGHIYCWACMLHYLSLSDNTWRKCPICYEAVHINDLKTVEARCTHRYTVNDTVTMVLMRRERGSVVSIPQSQWMCSTMTPDPSSPHHHRDVPSSEQFMKIVVASQSEIEDKIINKEQMDLLKQYEQDKDSPEVCFIETALNLLKDRIKKLSDGSHDNNPATVATGIDQENPSLLDCARKPSPPMVEAFSDDETDDVIDDVTSVSTNENEPVIGDDPLSMSAAASDEALSDILQKAGVPWDDATAVRTSTGGKTVFYFYQSLDGQNLFIHPLNIRCLLREYGSFENCPLTVAGRLVETQEMCVTENVRKRLRYLSHLPLRCEFTIIELSLKPPIISRHTLSSFTDEIRLRKIQRQKKSRDEQLHERKVAENLTRGQAGGSGCGARARYTLTSLQHFPEMLGVTGGMDDRCSMSTCSGTFSDSTSNRSLSESSDTLSQSQLSPTHTTTTTTTTTNTSTPDYDEVTMVMAHFPTISQQQSQPQSPTGSVPSFAQMLKTGSAAASSSSSSSRPDVWPRRKWTSAGPISSPDGLSLISPDADLHGYTEIPTYSDSFSIAISHALDEVAFSSSNNKATNEKPQQRSESKKKKKKQKQRIIFSTSAVPYKK